MARDRISIEIDGLRETRRALRQLPEDAQTQIKNRSKELSETIAQYARSAAAADDAPQTKLLVSTISAVKGVVPNVKVGGSKKVGRYRKPASAVVFGSEFGMTKHSGWYAKRKYSDERGLQYHRPHNGNRGYWFFPTVEQHESYIVSEWQAAADAVIRQFAQGG